MDCFSVLKAYEEVAKGLPGGFEHPALLTELKLMITRILCEEVRDLPTPAAGWPSVEGIVRRGSGDNDKLGLALREVRESSRDSAEIGR